MLVKNNKNGFTLIELLAVIVILAVIAMIATPIILNIINDSRESANCRSVEGYAEALKKNVITYIALNSEAPDVIICVGDGPANASCEIDATVAGTKSATHTGGVTNGRTVDYNGVSISCLDYEYVMGVDTLKLFDCKVGNTSGLYDYDSKTGAKKQ